MLTQLNFLLTNDQAFTYTGKGATTGILYSAMFHSYKKFLITKWDSVFHKEVVRRVNEHVFGHTKQRVNGGEDFTQDMEAAMARVLVLDSDDELDAGVLSDEDHGNQPQVHVQTRPSIAGANSDGVREQVSTEILDDQSPLSDNLTEGMCYLTYISF